MLSDRYRCIAPDQRGYRGSSKPQEVEAYTPDKLVGDVFLLADALGVDTFTIVGHDWGGAIAWGVAYAGMANGRVTRAIIANAPHPVIFPRLLYKSPATRGEPYFREFRDPANDALREHGLGALLMKVFTGELKVTVEPEGNAMLEDWSDPDAAIGMLNYYRASPMEVLDLDAPYDLPADYQDFLLPKLGMETLVIWRWMMPPCRPISTGWTRKSSISKSSRSGLRPFRPMGGARAVQFCDGRLPVPHRLISRTIRSTRHGDARWRVGATLPRRASTGPTVRGDACRDWPRD